MHPAKRIHAATSEKLKGKQVLLAVTSSWYWARTHPDLTEVARRGLLIFGVLFLGSGCSCGSGGRVHRAMRAPPRPNL